MELDTLAVACNSTLETIAKVSNNSFHWLIRIVFSDDVCQPRNPCQNGGSCLFNTQVANGYTCRCPPGFNGNLCQNTGYYTITNYIKMLCHFICFWQYETSVAEQQIPVKTGRDALALRSSQRSTSVTADLFSMDETAKVIFVASLRHLVFLFSLCLYQLLSKWRNLQYCEQSTCLQLFTQLYWQPLRSRSVSGF